MLKEATFKGGVHPPEFKSATSDKAIKPLGVPSRVILHLQQHIGAPLKAVVSVDDQVAAGQVLAEPTGFVSVPLHSSISGKVVAVEPYPHPSGVSLPAIVVESDGEDKWAKTAKGAKKYSDLSADELRKIVQQAGIVGLGGAAFPTHVKLSPPPGKPIDTFILNGAECEPWLTTDYRQMLERSKDLITGVKIVMRILEAERALVAVERNKPEAIEVMDRLCRDELNFDVVPLKTKYPQGGEKQLIQAVAGRQVPSGGLPMDVGCVVHNVSTVLSIFDAVAKGRPLTEKVVTVAGDDLRKAGNYRVRVGMTVRELLEKVGGKLPDGLSKVIMGGPMMGLALPDLDVPVLKSTNGLVLMAGQVPVSRHRPCLRCGSCVDSCPIHLMPCELALLAENMRFDSCREYSVKDCIECGSCSYTCPSGRNLVQLIRFAKYTVMEQDRRKKA
ncbi:MAG: electron transport complex subunit RsxC [Candidatus Glassbacteria bacterium]|nr:electron transport complex subunit RsxC [Candidatus Glassbacteria bacterium]